MYTIAVFSLMAAGSSSFVRTTTSFAPAARMALSKALRPPIMMTSPFIPVVSGSCQIFAGSVPAIQAAAPVAIADYFTQWGTIVAPTNFTATHRSDDVRENLREALVGGVSRLRHTWKFDNVPPELHQTT